MPGRRRMEEAEEQPDGRALPAPLGPRNPKISPSPTSIVRSSSARTTVAGGRPGGWTGIGRP